MPDLVADADGTPISLDCLHNCSPSAPALCEHPDCRCDCHVRAACADLAATLDAERYDRAALMRERYGPGRRR